MLGRIRNITFRRTRKYVMAVFCFGAIMLILLVIINFTGPVEITAIGLLYVNPRGNMNKESEIQTIQSKADLLAEDFEYSFNPQLTDYLDAITDDFDQDIVNTIALWKVNRYPYLDEAVLKRLNGIASDREYKEEHKELLRSLLCYRGVQLPMASTFMRFRNPILFQIIDQRVFRLLTGYELHLPAGTTVSAVERTCAMYFDYLQRLRQKSSELGIRFEKADRILYNADKRINGDKKLRNYGG